MAIKPSSLPEGFGQDFSGREAAAIGVFGPEGSGKTRFLTSAGIWAEERGTIPGWIVLDRKTRATVRQVCAELGLPLPLIHKDDFITHEQSKGIAKLDRESEVDSKIIQGIYAKAYNNLLDSVAALGAAVNVDPIVIETGTALWDWISFVHFGRKQGVGKSRVWGPPKQDWTDLLDSLSHKTVLISFWQKDTWKDTMVNGKVESTVDVGNTKPDGPPHVGYTTTTLVRLTHDKKRKLKADETFVDRFSLDVYESQENKALEGSQDVLTGEMISFSNLMALLRPE